MSDPKFYKGGLKFECLRCGACCTGEEGYVLLTDEDIERLMEGLGMTREEIIVKYLRSVGGKYSLQETEDGRCVFWAGDCTLYEHRPYQCRSFPFWPSNLRSKESWDHLAATCIGVGRGQVNSEKEIRDWLKGPHQELIVLEPPSLES